MKSVWKSAFDVIWWRTNTPAAAPHSLVVVCVCLLCYCYGPNHVTLSNLDSCLDVCSSVIAVTLTACLLLLRLELHTSSPLLPSRSRELPHEHQLFCVCVCGKAFYTITKQFTYTDYIYECTRLLWATLSSVRVFWNRVSPAQHPTSLRLYQCSAP